MPVWICVAWKSKMNTTREGKSRNQKKTMKALLGRKETFSRSKGIFKPYTPRKEVRGDGFEKIQHSTIETVWIVISVFDNEIHPIVTSGFLRCV